MLRSIDILCILSALLFFASNLLEIISNVMRGRSGSANIDSLKALDPDYLMNRWLGEDQTTANLALAAGVLKTFAWFSFQIIIIQVAWILSRGGKRQLTCHAMMGSLALAGTLAEVISRLMLIGSFMRYVLWFCYCELARWRQAFIRSQSLPSFLLSFSFSRPSSNWIAQDFNLYNWTDRVNDDMIGWRVLQIAFIVVEGKDVQRVEC